MDERGAKGYWISTARIINQDLFDEDVILFHSKLIKPQMHVLIFI